MMFKNYLQTIVIVALTISAGQATAGERWSLERAKAWGEKHPRLVGCNYIPSTAINQLEMWQAETFDPETIERELGWARDLGFNSIRVFLHDIPWREDRDAFFRRVDRFLGIAERYGIGVMLVPFDGVWDPSPKSGRQPAPKPHLHNSGWVQSPGKEILSDPKKIAALEGYIKDLVGRFRDDPRVHAWDLFNEPDNPNRNSYGKVELPDKAERALDLLRRSFEWARAIDPSQPLTSGVWWGDWSEENLSPMSRFQLENSDVISFHDYSNLDTLKRRIASLERFGRPILCTEYMARPAGSRFDPNLGYMVEKRIGAYNWGFVAGKSQTIYPWDSWEKTYTAEPPVWFHDIFRADGSIYDEKEVEYIRRVTGKSKS
ncbi:MAG: cellulase family glycosylhydrolase [Isosphaeraceae bacterium]|nr:cellulase family glycosylhydrolase [Isosphaeraceae bacterium]